MKVYLAGALNSGNIPVILRRKVLTGICNMKVYLAGHHCYRYCQKEKVISYILGEIADENLPSNRWWKNLLCERDYP